MPPARACEEQTVAAADALSGTQFRHFAGSTHTVEVWNAALANTDWARATPAERDTYTGSSVDPGHRPIGSLSWDAGSGEIKGVYVVPSQQRRGVASSMLAHARTIDPAVRHSSIRTSSGRAWSEVRP